MGEREDFGKRYALLDLSHLVPVASFATWEGQSVVQSDDRPIDAAFGFALYLDLHCVWVCSASDSVSLPPAVSGFDTDASKAQAEGLIGHCRDLVASFLGCVVPRSHLSRVASFLPRFPSPFVSNHAESNS